MNTFLGDMIKRYKHTFQDFWVNASGVFQISCGIILFLYSWKSSCLIVAHKSLETHKELEAPLFPDFKVGDCAYLIDSAEGSQIGDVMSAN